MVSTQAPEEVAAWPGLELNVVVDGSEYVNALLERSGDGVVQAVYSASPFLSVSQHNGLATELALTAVARAVHDGASNATLRKVLATIRQPFETPGARRLAARTSLDG